MMYTNEEPTSYTDSSEKFIKIYLRPSKLCGDNNGDCFATRYYEYKDNDKKVYTPTYKGSCAKLKNGASICLTPQVGGQAISGLIDINGAKSPNVLNKDLRTFTFEVQTQAGRNSEVAAVLETPFTPIQTDEGEPVDPCAGQTCGCGTLPDCPPECSSNPNNWDLTCCQENSSSITNQNHHCCTYSSIQSSVRACKTVHFELSCRMQGSINANCPCDLTATGYQASRYSVFHRHRGGTCKINDNRVDCNNTACHFASVCPDVPNKISLFGVLDSTWYLRFDNVDVMTLPGNKSTLCKNKTTFDYTPPN